ncbi:hypothetical protein GCM10025771_22360 [Niveibacterium umoris]|uniref:Sugar O-acyltransferase (Sialic acid O-acetyltransferase NeuD family) n=1 Tax=Niveibacterium umoris TaxID=1193620 RepID=A0A840BH87_9RHOO|nr:acetyltransferase [Niveibacterium umoris]MBB4012575.1 sugar O-acyltransferase (sialic acid O-acetyltransferase NeuD family) [Niveibacterium umoris]
MKTTLVIFGHSNILSDLLDCALAQGIAPRAIVVNQTEQLGERDLPLSERLAAFSRVAPAPEIVQIEAFVPMPDDLFVIGPTTPARAVLVQEVRNRFAGIRFGQLVHPTAYVSPLSTIGEGVFVGAGSVIGPGATLEDFAFINRGVTIGHDTRVRTYARVQPGSNVGGLTTIGAGATIGLGASVLERLVIGDGAFVGAGAVVIDDVAPNTLVVGAPAKFKKNL